MENLIKKYQETIEKLQKEIKEYREYILDDLQHLDNDFLIESIKSNTNTIERNIFLISTYKGIIKDLKKH